VIVEFRQLFRREGGAEIGIALAQQSLDPKSRRLRQPVVRGAPPPAAEQTSIAVLLPGAILYFPNPERLR
jgi:hypothetical protein